VSNTQRAAASQKRLNEFLQIQSNIIEVKNAEKLDRIDFLEFDAVDFTFPHTGIRAVNNFSLSIKRGEKIALIGKTGCGKSTVAQLLIRMFDPQQGQIRVNGKNIQSLNLDSLRKMISYVPQDVFLFSDSIHHNINFSSGEDNLQKSKMAAENAVILDEVESLPDGFETMIGERGVTLSGGQKQRISIARALSKENDLLIFDD
jgi:ATP-binding cassette subfamily B protein